MKQSGVILLLLALTLDSHLAYARGPAGAAAGRSGGAGTASHISNSHVGIAFPARGFPGPARVGVWPSFGWNRWHSPGFVGPRFYRPGFFSRYPGVIVVGSGYYYPSYTYYYEPEGYVPQVGPVYPQTAPVAGDSRVRSGGQWAPFDPTPLDIIDRMLGLAQVKKGDVLYDLGAGDGRVVIAAAKKYGVRAVGFEIDPGLVKLARENVRNQGMEKLVQIRQQDFMSADLSSATVVTLYLSYDGNLALRSNLENQLRPGARVVSYTFDMRDWQPKIAESYRDAAGNVHMLYLWQIAERPTN